MKYFSFVSKEKAPAIRRLVVFIIYGASDTPLAIALDQLLQSHFGPDLAEILIDTESFRHGIELNDQIQQQLKRTDILIAVYTAQLKPSYGFTGIELGFFGGLPKISEHGVRRRIIPFYRQSPPEATAGTSGVRLEMAKSILRLTHEEFRNCVRALIDHDHLIVGFLKDLESEVRAVGGIPESVLERLFTEERRLETARAFLYAMFDELKKTIDIENAPQKKLVIEVGQRLGLENFELHGDVILRPEGNGTMAIFGLPERETVWQEFLQHTNPKYRNAWKDAIEMVIASSMQESDVDNSQIIISSSGERLYRLLLSRYILFYDNRTHFHLYFLEITRRHDFGNSESTRLLKAIALCCRFHFLFFEKESEFSHVALVFRDLSEIKHSACRLTRELKLLKRDAMDLELNNTEVGRFMVDPPSLGAIHQTIASVEAEISRALQNILESEPSTLGDAKGALIEAVKQLEMNFRKANEQAIRYLGIAVAKLSGDE